MRAEKFELGIQQGAAAIAAMSDGTKTMISMTDDRSGPVSLALRAAFGVALLAGAAWAGEDGMPDLAPASVVGPGITYTDAATYVTVNVANIGDPLEGSYLVEVLLSTDNVLDGGDLVVATATPSTIGSISVPLSLPLSAPTGFCFWVARISGVSGELALANNQKVGNKVMVQTLDLALVDASPIHFSVLPTDDVQLAAEVVVENAGTAQSVLVFNVELLNPAPWLEITPPSSFAVGGEDGQKIALKANYVGVKPGLYPTKLRFQSYSHPNDFEELDVVLEVGDPKFIAGDRLIGQISIPGDSDSLNFDAVKGMLFPMSVAVKSGDIKPRLELIDPDGVVEDVIDFKPSPLGTQKVRKLKATGEYTVRVVDQDGTGTGGYVLRTGRKLPKKALARVVTVKASGSNPAKVEVRALPGCSLDFSIDPNAKFAGPIGLAFTSAGGEQLDILANMQNSDGDEIRVEDVEIETVDEYSIDVIGFGSNPKAKAVVHVLPVQPKKGDAKIYIP